LKREQESYSVFAQKIKKQFMQTNNNNLLFNAIYSSVGVGIATFDLNGICTDCNETGVALLAIDRNEFKYFNIKLLINNILPKDKYQVESCYHLKNGSRIWLNLSASAMLDENGKRTGTVLLFTDISKLKHAEELLQRPETIKISNLLDFNNLQLKDLFNLEEIQEIQDAFALATGVSSVITDLEGNPITQPSNFCEFCENVVRGTEKGLANCKRSDAVLGRLNPHSARAQICLSASLYDGGASINAGDYSVANWLVGQVLDEKSDMQQIKNYAKLIGADEEAYEKALAKVKRMPKEQFDNICKALHLITKQLSRLALRNIEQASLIANLEEKEMALRESEAQIKESQRVGKIGSYTYNFKTQHFKTSEELDEVFGISHNMPKTLKSWLSLIHPDSISSVNNGIRGIYAGKLEAINQEYLIISPNTGKKKWIWTHGELKFNNLGEPELMIGNIQDITERKLSELELIQYKDIISNMQTGVYVFHLENEKDSRSLRLVNANNASTTNLGLRYNDIINKYIYEIFPLFEDRNVSDVLAKVALTGNSFFTDEFRFVNNENVSFYFSVRVYALPERHISVLFEDVTARKESEKALVRERVLTDAIFNSIPGILYLYDIDGNLLKWNKMHETLTGYTSAELSKMRLFDLFKNDKQSNYTIKSGVDKAREGFGFAEVHLLSKSGPIPMYITAVPLTIDNKECFAGVGLDLTEKKKSESKVKEYNALLRSIIESSPDVSIFALDAHYNYIAFNQNHRDVIQQLLNKDISLGTSILEEVFNKAKDRLEIETNFERAIKGENFSRVRDFEIEPNHHIYWQDFWSPIYSDENRILGVTCFSLNITAQILNQQTLKQNEEQLKQQNEEYLTLNEELSETNERIFHINKELQKAIAKAEESDKLKTIFLANMSHEIRTPMNAIKGFAQLLNSPDTDSETRDMYIKIINQRTDDLLSLINDLLDISRIEAGQLPIVAKQDNLAKLFHELFQFFSEQNIEKLKNKVVIESQNELAASQNNITLDFFRLRQIFINLINNAIKFTEQGSIVFGCRMYNENTLLFFVKDSGIGIPADKQEIIFHRFRQVKEDNVTKEFGGAGLGLSIVKGILDLMDGKIWVESDVNQGATFYFTLPYVPAQKQQVANMNRTSSEYNWVGKTILIVEDDVYNAQLLSAYLKKTGADCLITGNAKKALDVLNSDNRIDLILMDIQLPDINGYTLTKMIREKNIDIPIIAQTAYASEKDKEKALDSGCNNHISKPIAQSALLQLIQCYISE
jgi:PAS domain S-box-containing protein